MPLIAFLVAIGAALWTGDNLLAQESAPVAEQAAPESSGAVRQDGEKPETVDVAIVDVDEAQARIDGLAERLATATKAYSDGAQSDDEFASLIVEALAVNEEAEALSQDFEPRVQRVEQRIAELKPTEEGAELSDSAKLEIDSQLEILEVLAGVVQQARVLATRAEDLSISIIRRQRAQFTQRLLQRDASILVPKFWREVHASVPRLLWRANLQMKRWQESARLQIDRSLAVIFFGVLLGSIYLIFFSRRTLLRRADRDPHAEPRPSRKVIAAAVFAVVNVVSAVIAALLTFLLLDGIGLIPDPFDDLVLGLLGAFTVYMLVIGLSRALIAPGRPTWRLLPITEEAAGRAALVANIGGAVVALAIAIETTTQALAVPIPITAALRAILAMVIAVLCLIGLRALSSRREEPEQLPRKPGNRGLWRLAVPFAWVLSLAAFVAPLFGFIALGWFVAAQLVFAAILFGVLYLLLAAVEEATTTGFQATNPGGRAMSEVFGFSKEGAEQVGVLAGGLTKLLLIVFAAIAMMVPWGLTTADLSRLEAMVTRFQVGGVTISITTIISAIAIFTAGFMVTRAVQRWLENRYLPKTRLDVGLKTSIRTGLGYVGIVIAAMLAFSHLGVQLSNLALVAGALSVGIGFGLQSMVSNFVSGLILLAERPIRTGDWVEVDGQHGTVRKINVRSTEIETFDRATMIVPNSDLIAKTVTNWVLNDNSGRIIIPVGVDYASDPEEVRSVLLECARGNPLILAYPEPSVFFMNFGDSALEFELRCYLSDIGMGLSVRSDLRFEIARRFKEAGIEMPFPQRVVHLRREPGTAPDEDVSPTAQGRRDHPAGQRQLDDSDGDHEL
ncbi:MAG: DUF3772 domain-containing protein [Pseudomonadota bacterium]